MTSVSNVRRPSKRVCKNTFSIKYLYKMYLTIRMQPFAFQINTSPSPSNHLLLAVERVSLYVMYDACNAQRKPGAQSSGETDVCFADSMSLPRQTWRKEDVLVADALEEGALTVIMRASRAVTESLRTLMRIQRQKKRIHGQRTEVWSLGI